jgi:hypothetical protein
VAVSALADAGVRIDDGPRGRAAASDRALAAVLVASAACRNSRERDAVRTDNEEHRCEGYIYV